MCRFKPVRPRMSRLTGYSSGRPGWCLIQSLMGRLVGYVFDTTGEGILRAGKAIDCSHAVGGPDDVHPVSMQFLTRAGGEWIWGKSDDAGVARDPPTMETLGIEAEIVSAWDLCRGLTLVTGVPGSGKSTLMAAGTRRLLERGAGRVQSYEAPIEFVFDGWRGMRR